MNGINMWRESFLIKESPLTYYLDTKGDLVFNLADSDLSLRLYCFVKRVIWNLLSTLFLYKYGASFLASRMGVYDFR